MGLGTKFRAFALGRARARALSLYTHTHTNVYAYHTEDTETKGSWPIQMFHIFHWRRHTQQTGASAHLCQERVTFTMFGTTFNNRCIPVNSLLSQSAPVPRLQQSRLQLHSPPGPHLQQPMFAALHMFYVSLSLSLCVCVCVCVCARARVCLQASSDCCVQPLAVGSALTA